MQQFWTMLGRCKTLLIDAVPDLLSVIGAALVAYGVFLIYPPAAWITAGAECIAGAVIWSRGYTNAGGDAK